MKSNLKVVNFYDALSCLRIKKSFASAFSWGKAKLWINILWLCRNVKVEEKNKTWVFNGFENAFLHNEIVFSQVQLKLVSTWIEYLTRNYFQFIKVISKLCAFIESSTEKTLKFLRAFNMKLLKSWFYVQTR